METKPKNKINRLYFLKSLLKNPKPRPKVDILLKTANNTGFRVTHKTQTKLKRKFDLFIGLDCFALSIGSLQKNLQIAWCIV